MTTLPPQIRWLPFTTDEALLDAVSQRWWDSIRMRQARTIALSGGRIAARLFQAVVSKTQGQLASWSEVHCFWADERCVGPEHQQSNYRIAKEMLLDPLARPPHTIHRLRGELPPDQAADLAETELLRIVGSTGRLDLVLLGMGEDGHVASLFPGQDPGEDPRQRHYLAVKGPKPPQDRLTLSLPAMVKAAAVWVVVSGPGKEDALRRALGGDTQLPIGQVVLGRPSTHIFSSVHVTDI